VLDGHDAFAYFPRLTEFHENISSGILYPRWAPDLSSGNGQPIFLFNPPLIYYVGELWILLGFSAVTAINLACMMVVFATAVAMFLLGRLYFGNLGGWLASAALLYAPYFAVDLYVRSALGEFVAFPMEVLAFYGFGAFARYGKRWSLALGAASYAGVLYSHNAAALLLSPLLGAFILFTAWRAGSWRTLLQQAAGVLLGVGLSAALWLPTFAERTDISLDRLLQGYLRYSNHFVYLHQLFYSPWGYGLSVAGPNDGMSFTIGWGHVPLALIACVIVARYARPGDKAWLIFFGAASIILSALMLHEAEWLWDNLPLLRYSEFPWRLLGPVAICFGMIVASLAPKLDLWPKWRIPAFAAAMALLIVPNLNHMAARDFRDVDPTFWTPRAIATRGVDVEAVAEYVPRWVTVPPTYNPIAGMVVEGEAEVVPTGRTPISWRARVSAHKPTTLQLARAYFPGWQVRIDGQPVPIEPAAPSGQIRFHVPAGQHRLDASFERTMPVRIGDTISLLSLAALIWYLFQPFVFGVPGRVAIRPGHLLTKSFGRSRNVAARQSRDYTPRGWA
jgi:hypothetical protein